MRGPFEKEQYDRDTQKFFADRTQQGGNPHQRSSVKNAGGGITNVSHPVSDAGWRLLLNDRKRQEIKMAGSPLPGGQTAPPNINSLAAQGIQGAGMGTATGMGYTPLSVTPNQLATTNLAPYMNPYTDAVIKQNEADILRGAQIGLNELSSQAQAAKSFGGSRHGIQGAELGRSSLEQLAKSSAGLRQANYGNAQQAAMQDINTNLQGQLANQSADLSGAGQRLGAANQLGQLSNLGFGMGQQVNQNLAQQGAMQQALQQMVMDNATNKFNQYTGHPAAGLGYLTNALNATPLNNAMYKNTTETKTPGLFDYLSLGASGYTGGN